MSFLFVLLGYFSLSLLLGYTARNTNFGWLGWTIVALFLSPIIGWGLYYLTLQDDVFTK